MKARDRWVDFWYVYALALLIQVVGCRIPFTGNTASQSVGAAYQPANEASANLKTAEQINTDLIPFTAEDGKPLLATQKKVIGATSTAVDGIKIALNKAQKDVGDLTAERDAYKKLYHDIYDSWLERTYRWIRAAIIWLTILWVGWHVLTLLTPFLPGGLGFVGAIMSRVSASFVPLGALTSTIADNIFFRRKSPLPTTVAVKT